MRQNGNTMKSIIIVDERYLNLFATISLNVRCPSHSYIARNDENISSYVLRLLKILSCTLADNRPFSQTVFMLSIAINRAEHVCATVIIKHNYMLMCNHKIAINIMLCLLNSTGHI